MRTLRIGLAQINPTVGDLKGNVQKILDYIGQARELGVDLVAFPELAITGYPPEDLLLKPDFIEANLDCLHQIVQGARSVTAVVGFVDSADDIYNSAAVIHDGALAGVYHKMYLPNNSDQTAVALPDVWLHATPRSINLVGEQRTLLAVLAHPGDEGFGIGGTLAKYAAEGVRVVLACATTGEAGEIKDPTSHQSAVPIRSLTLPPTWVKIAPVIHDGKEAR